jgi:hypothetical protein
MSDAPPVDASTATGDLRAGLTGIAFVLFGIQVTLVGLLAGSSFLAVVTGFALSVGGLLRALTS